MTNQISGNTNLSWYEKEAVGSRWDGNENWEYLEGFLANYRQRQDLFAQEGLESRWLLERLKTFNYLTNYIFYGSANPCKP